MTLFSMYQNLSEVPIGIYYLPISSLYVDENLLTLWVDLSIEKKIISKKEKGVFNFQINRISKGTRNDFKIPLKEEIFKIFEIFKQHKLPLNEVINFIMNPEQLGNKNEGLIELIKRITSHFKENDFENLQRLQILINDLPRKKISLLLSEKKYSLILGSLDKSEEVKNKVLTHTLTQLKKVNISKEDVDACFNNIIISEKVFRQVVDALNLNNIIAGVPPTSGGAVFIDMGGTGKSLMVEGLQKFWRTIGGTSITKNGIAEFTGDINYAKLIESWYLGSDNDNKNYDKKGLLDCAIEDEIPALLIVDEADRFIRTSTDNYEDKAADLITTEFKKYLQRFGKSQGVGGYVLTLFIANITFDDINPQLRQGGERLTPVYFGPPTSVEDWIELMNIYFKSGNLNFKNNNIEFKKKLAELILLHNSLMNKEVYMIVPRKFGPGFCEDYLSNHFTSEDLNQNTQSRTDARYEALHTKTKDYSQTIIDNNDFFIHIIEDLLLIEVQNARMNVEELRNKYYQFVGINSNSQNREDPNNGSNSNINPQLRDFYNKILKTKEIQTSFEEFFEERDKTLTRRKILNFIRIYHPDQYQIINEKEIATKILQFLNYCLEEVNKGEFDSRYIIRFF